MSNDFASLVKVPVLNGTTNYTDWAMEIKAHTQLGKFWRAIQGKNDPVDATATAVENSANCEEAALGLIKKTVIKTITLELRAIPNPSDSSQTIPSPTAKQLWAYLETKYLKKEGITSFYKFGVLFRCNLLDNSFLKQQINKLSDMRSICAMNECQGHSTQRLSACWPLPKCLLVQLELPVGRPGPCRSN